MAKLLEKTIGALRSILFSGRLGVREERIIRYILTEMQKGRSFEDVIKEPYVVNHTTPGMRARLVENPRIVHAIEDQVASQRFTFAVDYVPVRRVSQEDLSR